LKKACGILNTMIKKILVCTQTFPPKMGGMEAVIFSLAQRFSSRGINTLVACDKPYFQPEDFKILYCKAPKLIRSKVKRFMLNRENFQPDLTICDSWKSVCSVPNDSGPIVVLAHGQEYLKTKKKRIEIKRALSKAKLVVCSSKMTKSLVDSFNCPVQSIVIYPTYMLRKADSGHVATRRQDNPVNIASICRLDARKGLLTSAKALRSLMDAGFEFRWTIAGVGTQEKELREYIEDSNIGSCTKFIGRIEESEKVHLLHRTDLFLMPSYQVSNSLEGFGISYIEAASYGIPAIAGIAGGAPEAVSNGKTGWCVDGSDERAIEAALKNALADSTQRQLFGKLAQERFDRVFEGNVVFSQLLFALENTLK